MNEQPSSSVGDGNPVTRFFGWLFNWRRLRRMLIVVAWVATVIALFYGFENWRGRRAWKKHEQQLLARGEQLDFKAFLLKPVPDEQNFAATPFVASWSVKHNADSNIWQDAFEAVAVHIAGRRDLSRRDFIDLVAWQMAVEALRAGTLETAATFQSDTRDPQARKTAALAILEWMRDGDAAIAEMRAASARPYARYPIEFKEDPWSMAFPHLPRVKTACRRLQLRAAAELAAGQSTAALEDVKLMLYVTESVKDEPFVISYLVRVACRELAVQVIWEGLAQRAWSEAQLHELEARLNGPEFVRDLKHALAAEHAAGIMTPELIRKFGINYLLALNASRDSTFAFSKPIAMTLGNLIPSGWLYQEKLNYSRLFRMQQRPLFDEVDAAPQRISPMEVEAAADQMERELLHKVIPHRVVGGVLNHTLFSGLLLPALGSISARAATGDTATDQATLACALERYRLAHGSYPETLDALVPRVVAHLPADLITGAPYNYRRTDDGRFVLYSVGWNEKDDGGTPGPVLYDRRHGDWVWEYPSAISAQVQPAQKASAKRDAPGQTVLQRIAQNDATVFKLSPEQVQAFLAKSATTAESLLTAFNVTGNKDFLREAVRRFPESPLVLAAALTSDALPDQRGELLEQFKRIAPDNPLANYLSARDHLKNQRPDLALKELSEASSKSGFHDFTIERIQALEDIYLHAGYTPAEAKAIAMTSVHLPSVGQLRQLGRDISALQQQYAQSGDARSAETLARMGLTLAADITHGTGNSLLGQMVGTIVERDFLRALAPNGTYDFIAQPVGERLTHLDAREKWIRESSQFFDQWMQTANDGQLISFFDRLKLYGEPAAITWARSQQVTPAP